MKKSKTTKQMIAEINVFLDAMASNSFLVPSTHITNQFTNSNDEYKTYCDDGRKYIVIEITGEKRLSLSAHKHSSKWTIDGKDILHNISTSKQIKDAHSILQEIHNEIHSLDPNKIRVKELRKSIKDIKDVIKDRHKEIIILEKEISDYNLLTKK